MGRRLPHLAAALAGLVLSTLCGPAAVAGPVPVDQAAARPVLHHAGSASSAARGTALSAPQGSPQQLRARAAPRWRSPLDGSPVVVRAFSAPLAPWLPGHRGVDLAARAGAPVRSAGTGVVVFAGIVAGVGVVSVDHGGLRTTYQPVLARVHRGQRVRMGEQLGRLVATGGHCLPAVCLHWGLISSSGYLDPLTLLGLAPVRLLPLGTGRASRMRPD